MTDKQPEALRLASMIERYNNGVHSQAIVDDYSKAAAELRRLHEVNAELATVLRDMVQMIDIGDEHGAGSQWHTAAKAALTKAEGK